MRRRYTYRNIFFILALLAAGRLAHAHATPIDYVPEAASAVTTPPTQISIRFTERIEPGASNIAVFTPSGAKLSSNVAIVRASDPHFFELPFTSTVEGTYTISWQVVSADDGHFTKGAFSFTIGAADVSGAASQTQVAIVHSSPLGELVGVGIELLGHALIYGIIVLLFLIIPKLLPFDDAILSRIRRRMTVITIAAAILTAIGVSIYIWIKTGALAVEQNTNIASAFQSFMTTTAGTYAAYRVILAAFFAAIAIPIIRRLAFDRKGSSMRHALIAVAFLIAAARVRSSHATAADLLPYVTIFDHFIHTIFKNAWTGIIVATAYVFAPIRTSDRTIRLRETALAHAAPILAIAIGGALTTGVYIGWLDLKEFENIFRTAWGKNFIVFSAFLVPLVAMRAYHSYTLRPQNADISPTRDRSATIHLELVLAIAIVFATAANMITTPPLAHPRAVTIESSNLATPIVLGPHPYEPKSMKIAFGDASGAELAITRATITLTNEEKSIGPIVAHVERRSKGSFVFASSELSPDGVWKIEATGARADAYDAVGAFEIAYPAAFLRSFDSVSLPDGGWFSVLAILGAVGSIGIGVALFFIATRSGGGASITITTGDTQIIRSRRTVFVAYVGVLIYAASVLMIRNHHLASAFERACAANGDQWHTMPPSRDSRAQLPQAYDGCMIADGSFAFIDANEYAYFTTPVALDTAITVRPPDVGSATSTIEVAITDGAGDVLEAFVRSHDRILHTIIVSADFQEFAHIHAEDFPPSILERGKMTGRFELPHRFARTGAYLIGVDYRINNQYASAHQTINALGGEPMRPLPLSAFNTINATFGEGSHVTFNGNVATAGMPSTIAFHFSNASGTPVTDLQPYLAAPMHLAIVKEDLSEFLHAHGEIHKPGDPIAPSSNTHAHAPVPPAFGPDIEAHITFPSPGIYHVYGQFRHRGEIHLAHFVMRVE